MKNGKSLRSSTIRGWVVAALLIAGCSASVKAEFCVDSLALVEFYEVTNGPGWTSSTNWLTGPVSTWQGVTIENGRVTGLSLPFNNVSGSIPYHIALLQKLETLNLRNNNLTGSIPGVIAFLQELKMLNLSSNQLTGGIPSVIGFLSSLEQLDLSVNELNGSIPASIVLLSDLTYLNLSENNLSGSIPSQVGSLSKLEQIFLHDNQLTGSIPSSISGLNNARDIFLQNNKLSGQIPSSIGGLDSVVFFNASNNRLTGAVPAAVANLDFIYYFNVDGNRIQDVPNLSGVSSLFQLYVANNRLTFADIEPNMSKVAGGNYAPQDSVGSNKTVSVCVGDTLTLSANVIEADADNSFVWFNSDFSFISDPSSSPELIIPNVTLADAGTYSAEISNANVPDLFLYRKTIKVNVKNCATSSVARSGDMEAYPVPFTDDTNVEIKSSTKEPVEIVITNADGNVLERRSANTNEKVSIGSQLGKGTYYVQSVRGGKKEVIRVIKK